MRAGAIQEDFRRLRAVYVDFAAALAAVEIVARGALLASARDWASALETLALKKPHEPWPVQRDSLMDTEVNLLEAGRRQFGVPPRAARVPPMLIRRREQPQIGEE